MDSLLDFGTQFIQQLSAATTEPTNIVYSPFSITCALFLLMFGSNGSTRNQLTSKLISEKGQLDLAIASLQATVSSMTKRNDTAFANFAFVDDSFPLSTDFSAFARSVFGARMTTVNFENDTDAVIRQVNKQVNLTTHGLIKKVVEALSPDSKLILLNALYFKGHWKYNFDERRTKKRNFNLEDGRSMPVEMMYLMGNLRMGFSGALNCLAVQLPYSNGRDSFIILLPMEGSSVNELIQNLSFDRLQELVENQMVRTKTKLYMPKFRVSWSSSLVPFLRSAGITDLFEPSRANLTLSNSSGLYVDEFLHKVVLEVDESGSEGAAISKVLFKQRSLSFAEEFIVDRPFLYLVGSFEQQKTLANILFLGKYAGPVTQT